MQRRKVLLSLTALQVMALSLVFSGGVLAQDDTDGDGYTDDVDWCPNDGDWGLGVDESGCPFWDTDGDGYTDDADWCPEDGDWGLGVDDFGCPFWDTDEDGIHDVDDYCPDQGDEGNGLDEYGCPLEADGGSTTDPGDEPASSGETNALLAISVVCDADETLFILTNIGTDTSGDQDFYYYLAYADADNTVFEDYLPSLGPDESLEPLPVEVDFDFWVNDAYIGNFTANDCEDGEPTGGFPTVGSQNAAEEPTTDQNAEEPATGTNPAGALGENCALSFAEAGAVLKLVNQARQQAGLKALTLNDQLNGAACRHSKDMARGSFLDHTGSDGSSASERLTAAGYPWTTMGENIAQGYPDAQSVFEGWMKSPGHRANILNPAFTEMRLSRIGDFWTQTFGTR